MKVSGTATLTAERAAVWAALNDPAVLVATIPGCRRLETIGTDTYAMTVAAGVGSIKGVYDGEVRLTDQEHPGSFRMHAQGSGAAGTIGAQVAVTLTEAPGGGTALTYDADAVVGGMIGGVGQRMLTGVSKRMADEFFGNVERLISSGVVGAASGGLPAGTGAPGPSGLTSFGLPPGPATVAPAPSVRPPAAAGGAPGGVYVAPNVAQPNDFVRGLLVGGAIALAGAVVGGWIAGRRR